MSSGNFESILRKVTMNMTATVRQMIIAAGLVVGGARLALAHHSYSALEMAGTRVIKLVLFLGVPAAAQWLNLPTPGIPRTSDGKPNLAAPAPKTSGGKPDFSGMWIPRDILPCSPTDRGVQCTELPLTPQLVNFAA